MIYIYTVAFLLSFTSVIYVGLHNFKNIEPFFWGISLIIPASILGYLLTMITTDCDAIRIANDVAFIDGTLLMSLIFSGILKEMKVRVNNLLKAVIYITNLSIYLLSVLPFSRRWFYADFSVNVRDFGNIISTKPGPLMIFHEAILTILVVVLFSVRVDVEFRQHKEINKVLKSYFIIVEIAAVVHIANRLFGAQYNMLPVVYSIGLAYLSFNYKDKFVHDIEAIVANVFDKGDCGYVAFDVFNRLVSFNENAVKLFPELESISIDTVITEEHKELYDIFVNGQRKLNDGLKAPAFVEINGKRYQVSASFFYMVKNESTAGTVFKIEDYTEQQIQEDFVSRYDDNVHNEVEKQLKQVKKKYLTIERNIAEIIENRDSISGGHATRTGDVMQIVVKTMAEHKVASLTYDLAEEMSRAAILHDIGKIAVNDFVLCKLGKYTKDEYEMMKIHTIKGGEIVSQMFDETEDEYLTGVAVNVAKYHHERYDGTGYPEGLKGEEIPLEARIMSFVDAFDAMVTERNYKDKMSFKEAEREVMSCIGTQFDPMIKQVFTLCKPQLESYYSEINS